jgi:cysteine desulfuration protein SufE
MFPMKTQSIQEKIDYLSQELGQLPDWEERYKKLIEWGKKCEPLTTEEKSEKYLVKGCQSQVWLFPMFQAGKLIFKADSDAILVKGIVSLLVFVFSHATPEEILQTKGDFLSPLGITEHLSMNRTNGLRSMIKQIQLYAVAFQAIKGKSV